MKMCTTHQRGAIQSMIWTQITKNKLKYTSRTQ